VFVGYEIFESLDIELNDSLATVFCYGTATQYKTSPSGKNTRTFIGSYNLKLIKEEHLGKYADLSSI